MDFKRTLKTLILAIAGGAFTLTAFAQWEWLDKDGRKVFSDRAPHVDIQEKNILKRPPDGVRPSTAARAGAASAAAASPALAVSAAKANTPKLSGKDSELEAKKKLEEEKVAKTKSENCDRAKNGLATLQSGVRMASVNAKGEREVYDDIKRAVEVKRTQEVIDETCK